MATQLDLYRDDPKRLAQVWREAAEGCRQQFPDDEDRYRFYADAAERLERMQ